MEITFINALVILYGKLSMPLKCGVLPFL